MLRDKSLVPSWRAVVTGQVQGLGFRPYVYRLAQDLGVTGYVANSARGVEILCQGRAARSFLDRLRREPPLLARITGFTVSRVRSRRFATFRIRASRMAGPAGVEVLPDIASCAECRREIRDPGDRRHGYPFTNCTQCGPRYTIIESLPYDRPRTTMAGFRMCPDCGREYSDPGNRRFHAQPNACPVCGPRLYVLDRRGSLVPDPGARTPEPGILRAARAIAAGRVVAVKSLGGFQLACDATSSRAVALLRRRKKRPDKPFALMCDSVAAVRRFCRVSRGDEALLRSAASPVVLLPKLPAGYCRLEIAGPVAPGNSRYGVMLAYSPLHVLLFAELRRLLGRPVVLVMTSANRRDAPITATDEELRSELGGVFDLALSHDRPIANRCDDSVVMAGVVPSSPTAARRTLGVEGERQGIKSEQRSAALPVRLARGYAPLAIGLDPMFHVKRPVLGVGGDMKNAFCLAEAGRAFMSPHIGDLESPRSERFFLETLGRLVSFTGIRPEVVACDMHPDYVSARLAERLATEWRVPLVRTQHHHAHTVSCLAEHGIRERTLGVALDGTGYGTDGAIWGCELLVVEPDFSWRRAGHLEYLKLLEPAAAVPDPGRVAAAYAAQAGTGLPGGMRARLGWARRRLDAGAGVNTSSLGRLFDAVAGLTGVCARATFDGQAPTALEAAAAPFPVRSRPYPGLVRRTDAGTVVISARGLLERVARDMAGRLGPGLVAARFHDAVAGALALAAGRLCAEHGIRTVAISGGAAQNERLRTSIVRLLSRHGLVVVHNRLLPLSDGGVALGQAMLGGEA